MFDFTGPHLHLLLNHLPVEGMIFSTLLLLYAFARNRRVLFEASLLMLMLTGLTAIPASKTGGGAAGGVKKAEGVMKDAIKPHAQFSSYALYGCEAIAVLSLAALVLGRRARKKAVNAVVEVGPPKPMLAVILVLALVNCYLLAYTAHLGGLIRHPEIEKNWKPPVSDSSEKSAPTQQ
jgi:hypothetical protein